MGPLISKTQLDRVCALVDEGQAEGAKLYSGGHRVGDQGFLLEPTILTETTLKMSVAREEIFGPVLCAMTFDDVR